VQRLDVRTKPESELVDLPLAGTTVRGKSIGLASQTVERQHEQRQQSLPIRVRLDEVGQLCRSDRVPATVQISL
jgi:hypothetical protein